MRSAKVILETVKGRDDVGMRLQIDPLCDVLLVCYLAHDELLAEILMVDNICRVADYMFNLTRRQMLSKNLYRLTYNCLATKNSLVHLEQTY